MLSTKIILLSVLVQSHGLSLRISSDDQDADSLEQNLLALKEMGLGARWGNSGCEQMQVLNWHPGFGNRLAQLVAALGYAELAECPNMSFEAALNGTFEAQTKELRSILALPDDGVIDIKKPYLDGVYKETIHCTRRIRGQQDPSLYFGCALSLGVRKRITDKYLVPLLRYDNKQRPLWCGRANMDFDGLVIHMRGGDVFKKEASYLQPPCSMYKDIIESDRYKRVLVIYNARDEPQNPCMRAMLKAKPRGQNLTFVRWQGLTIAEDACTIITSRNLVLSQSAFARSLALFNPHFRTMQMYEPTPHTPALHTYKLSGAQYMDTFCKAAPLTKFYPYPEVEYLKRDQFGMQSVDARVQWLTSPRREPLSETRCPAVLPVE